MEPTPFRFDAERHVYTALDTGEQLPYITGMLERTGWSDSRWYTEESQTRGTAVHQLTADYDMDALDVASCVSPYRGWLLGHVAVMAMLKPDILRIEEAFVHAIYRYGGRPDRVLRLGGLLGIWEVKSGAPEKAHPVQTALQAILVAPHEHLPPEALARYCCYLKDNGKFKVVEHTDPRDFVIAREVLKECGCSSLPLRESESRERSGSPTARTTPKTKRRASRNSA